MNIIKENIIKEYKVKEKYNSYITDISNNVKINIQCDDINFLNKAVYVINQTIDEVFYTD